MKFPQILAVFAAVFYCSMDVGEGNFSLIPGQVYVPGSVVVSGIRYLISKDEKNWYDAFSTCQRIGMRLASPDTKAKNTALVKYLISQGMVNKWFWLSATDLGSKGKYVWMSTGQPVSHSDWWKGQPDNAFDPNAQEIEHCVHYMSFGKGTLKWNDLSCSWPKQYICEERY